MRQRTQNPIGRPLPRPQDNSARDGGTLVTFGAIPRGIVVSPTRRCVAVATPGTGQADSVRLPLTRYDDPAHLLALAMCDLEARRGRLVALLVTAVLTSLAYWWLP